MIRYIIRRLLWMIVLLFAVTLVTFVIFYVLPSTDPALRRAGARASPATVAAVRHNLDWPWKESQIKRYYNDLIVHHTLGHSYASQAPVGQIIRDRLPATIQLTVGAAIVWLLIAFPVGMVSALRRGSILDRTLMGGALLAISAPVYWLGLVALYLFDQDVGRFKIFPGIDSYVPPSQDLGKWFASMFLPWVVLAASFAAVYARLLRGNLLEVMSEDYIRTARSKGLPERRVVMKHGVRSAVTPIVTILGIDVGVLLGGAVLTESVFNIPGIGRLSYDAINRGDLPMIQGTVLVAAFFVIIMNLVVDIAYSFLDPRVRY
jgi:peptide/nickel transport system permease protein